MTKYASVFLDSLHIAIHRNDLVESQGRSAKTNSTTQQSRPVHLRTHTHTREIFYVVA